LDWTLPEQDYPGLSSYWRDEFQHQDFESVWNLAEPLTDEEKDLFKVDNDKVVVESVPNMDMLPLTALAGDDPILSSAVTAGLEDIPSAPFGDFLPASDAQEPDSSMIIQVKEEEEEDSGEDDVNVDVEESSDVIVDYPISIHSYSLPPRDFKPENALAGDEVHYEESSEAADSDDSDSVQKTSTATSLRLKPAEETLQQQQRRSNRQPKRKRKYSESDSDDVTDTENVAGNFKRSKIAAQPKSLPLVNAAKSVGTPTKKDTFSNGKKKLYKSGPFNNPEMERARLNAINAKRNRDRKKNERQRMEQEMNRLKSENQGLKRTANKMKERADSAESELQKIREMLRANNLLEAVMKATGNAS